MRRPAAVIAAVFTATLFQLSPVLALTCTPDGSPAVPNAPLPASCFEGYDGDQVDSDGSGVGNDRLDWQSILAVTHSLPDDEAGNNDSQFGPGGNEETPDSWTFDFGSLGSDKYDLVSGYVAQEPGATDVIVALGFIRSSNNGMTHLAFELNQLAPGYRTATQSHSGAQVKVPTRSNGDLLITYSVDPPSIGLCRWSGNQHSGQWLDFNGNHISGSACPAAPASIQQGAMNANQIPGANNFLGNGALAAKTFAEGSINLTEAFKIFDVTGCFTFNYAWLHSRSSAAITSNQQDYILPTSPTVITNCPPPPPTLTPTLTAGATPTTEGSVAGGTGTPVGSLPNAAMGPFNPGQPWAALGFGLILIASLGVLAVANVRSRST